MRELREETGYAGNHAECEITGALPLSPGLSDETVALVTVPIDMNIALNKNPKQKLEETEAIELMKVPLHALKDTLDDLQRSGNAQVFLGLHCIAMGLSWGNALLGETVPKTTKN